MQVRFVWGFAYMQMLINKAAQSESIVIPEKDITRTFQENNPKILDLE